MEICESRQCLSWGVEAKEGAGLGGLHDKVGRASQMAAYVSSGECRRSLARGFNCNGEFNTRRGLDLLLR